MRQTEKERRPLARRAPQPDGATVRYDDSFRYRQAKPDTARIGATRLEETIEHSPLILGGHSATGVCNTEDHGRPCFTGNRSHGHFAIRRGKLESVSDKIAECLM